MRNLIMKKMNKIVVASVLALSLSGSMVSANTVTHTVSSAAKSVTQVTESMRSKSIDRNTLDIYFKTTKGQQMMQVVFDNVKDAKNAEKQINKKKGERKYLDLTKIKGYQGATLVLTNANGVVTKRQKLAKQVNVNLNKVKSVRDDM